MGFRNIIAKLEFMLKQYELDEDYKYFQIYFRGTVSSGECCRTDRADYDGNSKAGYYAEQKLDL